MDIIVVVVNGVDSSGDVRNEAVALEPCFLGELAGTSKSRMLQDLKQGLGKNIKKCQQGIVTGAQILNLT